jgi:hypothetical protein
VLKFSNAFTWDAKREDTSPDTTSANITEMSRSSQPARRSAAPSPPTQRDERSRSSTTGGGGKTPHETETGEFIFDQFECVISFPFRSLRAR